MGSAGGHHHMPSNLMGSMGMGPNNAGGGIGHHQQSFVGGYNTSGCRDDELLFNLLRERNQGQMSGGGLAGVVPSSLAYNNNNNNNSGPPPNGMPTNRGSMQGNFTFPAMSNVPFDLANSRDHASAVGYPPYTMMRDVQHGEMTGSHHPFNHEQQRSSISNNTSNNNNGFSLPGYFDAARPTEPSQLQYNLQSQSRDGGDVHGQSESIKTEKETAAAAPRAAPKKNNSPKKASKKTPKDGPRRPLSAYNLFFSDERERILKEREDACIANGDQDVKSARRVQVQEMAKIIGSRWRNLSDESRMYYQELADKDMKRHKEAKKGKLKDSSAPKRPPTAFLLFSNKRRKALKVQNPSATNSDLSKMLSISWREASDDIRRQYMDEATGLSRVYKADIASWRKNSSENNKGNADEDDITPTGKPSMKAGKKRQFLPAEDSEPPKVKAGKGKTNKNDEEQQSRPTKKRKTKDPSAPKRPVSAFLAFSNTRRKALKQKYPESTNADLSKMLSKMWREASNEFRQDFIDEAARLSESYKADIAEWRMKNEN
ncbi:hypothetical protein ACA910_003174 [Epithemia clementina (nom. ined.)]